MLELGIAAATTPVSSMRHLPHVYYATEDWDDKWVPPEWMAPLMSELDAGDTIAVRVNVAVAPKSSSPQRSFFDLFVRRMEGVGRQRPLIVREGITISDDRTAAVYDHLALIVIDDRALATFVGDAETPAHTELQHQQVKDKYSSAKKTISLLRGVASYLLRSLDQGNREDDPLLLAQFFPVATEEPISRQSRPMPAKGDGPDVEPPMVPLGSPARFRLSRLENGFRVRGNTSNPLLPAEIAIRMAYEVRRGNPLKKFKRSDFSLLDGRVTIALENAEAIATEDNRLVIRPKSRDFAASVTGFDSNRNLFVRVTAE